MTRLNVNPTRMELKKLKARLSTATRGHKLLKDKSDEMIRRFSALIKENKRLRDEVEAELADCLKEFSLARSVSSVPALEKAFSMPSVSVKAEFKTANVMSVEVPEIVLLPAGKAASSEDAVPYSYAELTSEADYSVRKIGQVLEKLFRLAETEKTVAMLSAEIERNKRQGFSEKKSIFVRKGFAISKRNIAHSLRSPAVPFAGDFFVIFGIPLHDFSLRGMRRPANG